MKKTLLLLIITSLLLSSMFIAPAAEAQTKQQINTITKRYGIYIGIAAALGTTAAVCAAIPSPAGSSPGPILRSTGDFCATFQKAGENLGSAAKEFFEKLTDYLVKYALNVIKQRMLAMLTDQIVTWIQGGGNPKFVTNWKDFMQDAGNQAIGDVIRGAIPQLCSPFSAQVGIVLKTPGILLPVQKFGPASCTLDQVVENIQGFYKDFRSGGWVAYQTSWQPQNNFYGSLLLTIDAANIEASAQAEAAKNEANSSNGFLSEKRCDVTISTDTDSETIVNQSESQIQQLRQNLETGATLAVRNCQIITPGSFVGSLAAKAVGSKVDAWIQADDIGPYLDVILNAAINRLTEEGTKGLLGLATNENASSGGNGNYPDQNEFDDIVNNYTVPPQEVLVQGGQCTTEDGQEGIYVSPPNGSGALEELFCQSITTTGAVNQLSAQHVAYRTEMIEMYKNMLDNQRKMLLLKKKTLHHMNSVVFFAQTVFPQIESCPANPDWEAELWGTHVLTPGENSIVDLGRAYSEAESGPSEIAKVEGEIEKTNAIIASINNRLNQLQAPHDKFTGQTLGIPASQVGNYYTGLQNLASQQGTQAQSSGAQLINSLMNTQSAALAQLVGLGGTNTNIPITNTTQGPEGYVAILLNDTFTLNREGGSVIVPPISPIFVDQNDPLFTPASAYSQFFSDTTLTNEVVDALWISYQNFKLENWLTSESVTTGSSFFNKNIRDAIELAYRPYFDLFSRDLYHHTNFANMPSNWSVTSSPDPESVPNSAGLIYLGGGGLIGYLTAGTNGSNSFVPPGYGLYTNCTGQAVFNQAGY
jgi:hypothetical protein